MSLTDLPALANPLSEQQLSLLQQALSGCNPQQLAWVSGYLAGISLGTGVQAQPQASVPTAAASLSILYASQTGNAKGVAEDVLAQAQAQGLSAELINVADFKGKKLKDESHVLVIASTNGEGEPPDDALALHEFLGSKKAPKLEQLKYAVLALGDSSYEFFCQTGKDFDQRLAALGATPLLARVDCDVDYDDAATEWTAQVLGLLAESMAASAPSVTAVTTPVATVSQYTKKNPYAAEVSISQKITGRDSAKDVRHIEIDLADSGLSYQPGDALGVWFENDPQLVEQILERLALSSEAEVQLGGETVSLARALTEHLELTQANAKFVEFWANTSNSKKLLGLIEDKDALRNYANQQQILDVLLEKKAKVTAQDLVDNLRKITPRLYSIASSQQEVDEEVHLTVGVVRFGEGEQQRLGGASGFLAERAKQVKVFVEHNDNFRLPSNPDTPVIMIGPGTGVAPFRAFLQQRDAEGASGDNWLFFGDQTFTQDFLYQVEWQAYLKSGLLSRLDLAFSRDQQQKIYVQDRIKQQAADLYAWLERGAHLYICGDANRMAKDVHQALIEVVSEQGGQSLEQAEDYLQALRSNKRYQKDVY